MIRHYKSLMVLLSILLFWNCTNQKKSDNADSQSGEVYDGKDFVLEQVS